MKITEHNVNSGKIVVRDATIEELEQQQKDLLEIETQRQARLAAAQAKQNLLQRLGITEEEARLLLG